MAVAPLAYCFVCPRDGVVSALGMNEKVYFKNYNVIQCELMVINGKVSLKRNRQREWCACACSVSIRYEMSCLFLKT